MSNTDLILGFLGEIHPEKFCDDCLSTELDIYPRQQVNQICRKLETKGMLSRQVDTCVSCGKIKKVNGKTTENQSIIQHVRSGEVRKKAARLDEDVDLFKIRRKIISICSEIWDSHKSEEQPYGLSQIINILKKEGFIPSHQANMMLTLNSLRNSFEYEGVVTGEEEKAIAKNAWKIIEKWKLNDQSK